MSEERLNSIQEFIELKTLLAEANGGLTSSDKKIIDLWNYTIDLQQELTKYKERCEKAIEKLEALIVFWKKYNPIDNYMQVEQFKGVISILEDKEKK